MEEQLPKITWCAKCTYPSSAAVPITFDEKGICSGCRVAEQSDRIDWKKRAELFKELAQMYKSKDGYDCVVPVSGGKDSYYAVHLALEYGMKPLLVTYYGNNFLPEGEHNLRQMKDVFGADHIIFSPSLETLVKLNRLGFKIHGDMNWHNHCGILTYPVQVAVKYKIPLVLWGNQGFVEQVGMYSLNDFFEFTAKDRHENGLHGFDWYDFVEKEEGLTAKDLLWAKYPSDEDIMDVGVRGVYLSNFFPYDGNFNANLSAEKYGWKAASNSFERTYRKISNVDDMHENGVHDYLKWIKFGYGRTTDHTSYDIRLGKMSRDEGVRLVKKHDHIKPSDLKRWLQYVNMTENEFDNIADTFRNPRVWKKINGTWMKQNIWD